MRLSTETLGTISTVFFMQVILWILPMVFNPDVVTQSCQAEARLQEFCVDLDTQPATSPWLVLFVVCHFVRIRHGVTHRTRSFERQQADNIARRDSLAPRCLACC